MICKQVSTLAWQAVVQQAAVEKVFFISSVINHMI